MKLYLLAVGTFLAGFHAVAYTIIPNPKYPGTNIPYAYDSWNCFDPSACIPGTSFTPERAQFFSAEHFLNETGVCRSLGYLTAIPNSSRAANGSTERPRLSILTNGVISGGVAGRSVTSIACDGHNPNWVAKTLVTIPSPKDPLTQRPFAYGTEELLYMCPGDAQGSNEDAVCRTLGHTKAVRGSSYSQTKCATASNAIAVRADGTRVTFNTSYKIMPSIICIH